MAVKKKTELMEQVKTILGEDTSDNALALVADLSDTIDDYETRVQSTDAESWKKKYEDNDKMWRERYRERFFSGGNPTDNKDQDEDRDLDNDKKEPELKTDFNELFK